MILPKFLSADPKTGKTSYEYFYYHSEIGNDLIEKITTEFQTIFIYKHWVNNSPPPYTRRVFSLTKLPEISTDEIVRYLSAVAKMRRVENNDIEFENNPEYVEPKEKKIEHTIDVDIEAKGTQKLITLAGTKKEALQNFKKGECELIGEELEEKKIRFFDETKIKEC